MKVYRDRFVLADEHNVRETYIHSEDVNDALRKLAGRVPGEAREIHIESVNESHRQFIIGSGEETF